GRDASPARTPRSRSLTLRVALDGLAGGRARVDDFTGTEEVVHLQAHRGVAAGRLVRIVCRAVRRGGERRRRAGPGPPPEAPAARANHPYDGAPQWWGGAGRRPRAPMVAASTSTA